MMGPDARNRIRSNADVWLPKTWPAMQDLLLAQGFVLANGDGHRYPEECPR